MDLARQGSTFLEWGVDKHLHSSFTGNNKKGEQERKRERVLFDDKGICIVICWLIILLFVFKHGPVHD